MSIFRRKKTPEQLVRLVGEQLDLIATSSSESALEKAKKELTERTAAMKVMLVGTAEKPPNPSTGEELSRHLQASGLVARILDRLPSLDFEQRKTMRDLWLRLVRDNHSSFATGYVVSHPELLTALVNLHAADEPTALVAGAMLREALTVAPLRRTFFTGPDGTASTVLPSNTARLLALLDTDVFAVQLDAFKTMTALLTEDKPMVVDFLTACYDSFFDAYRALLTSENYITRREALKLLGALLLARHNVTVMKKFVSEKRNLVMVMKLLRDKNVSIQFEAFHVFKVFAVNPSKPQDIRDILANPISKPKLIEFLLAFQNDRAEEVFRQEKALCVKSIRATEPSDAARKSAEEEAKRRADTSASAGEGAGAAAATGTGTGAGAGAGSEAPPAAAAPAASESGSGGGAEA